jgi:hypothetical protein
VGRLFLVAFLGIGAFVAYGFVLNLWEIVSGVRHYESRLARDETMAFAVIGFFYYLLRAGSEALFAAADAANAPADSERTNSPAWRDLLILPPRDRKVRSAGGPADPPGAEGRGLARLPLLGPSRADRDRSKLWACPVSAEVLALRVPLGGGPEAPRPHASSRASRRRLPGFRGRP